MTVVAKVNADYADTVIVRYSLIGRTRAFGKI